MSYCNDHVFVFLKIIRTKNNCVLCNICIMCAYMFIIYVYNIYMYVYIYIYIGYIYILDIYNLYTTLTICLVRTYHRDDYHV